MRTIIDKDGKEQMFYMGSYGIGVTRTIQASRREIQRRARHHLAGAVGAIPCSHCAAFDDDESLRSAALTLHDQLIKAGVETILDDRDERAGVKLNDADLIGIPLRVNIGAKSFEKGNFELKDRAKPDVEMVAVDSAVETIKKALERKLASPMAV